jgi:hypothetical protein
MHCASVRDMKLRALARLSVLLLAAASLAGFAQPERAADRSASLKVRSPQKGGSLALERTFSAGEMSQFRIQLSVRSEVEGEQPETIGAKTYVHPFARSGEQLVSWRATVHILSVAADGSADVEETLDDFSVATGDASPAGDSEAGKLEKALEEMAAEWVKPETRTLRYRETRAGQLLGLQPAGVPQLAEAAPPLLTLWLLRALRPAAALPERAVAFGERWQEPRSLKLEGWTDVRAFESGEWIEPIRAGDSPAALEPAARLMVVQQFQAKITAGAEKSPEGAADGRFHAESLSTISLGDGRVLAATRSATRELSWTLAPVAGLDRLPEFRARLSVQVEIEECHGSCTSIDDRAHD